MHKNSYIIANTARFSAPRAIQMHFAWLNFHYIIGSWNCKAAPQSKVMQYYTGRATFCNL